MSYSYNVIGKLFDVTKDTDHDLRFMALSDLNKIALETPEKFTNNSSYQRSILQYAQILIQSLEDQHSEIQNQAVNCFIPLTPMLMKNDLLKFLKQLILTENDSSSLIISSVHTMAVNTILKNLKIDQSKNHDDGEEIVSFLLQILLNHDLLLAKIDSIEILNHVIQYLGQFCNDSQLVSIYQLLITVIFEAENTISKNAIIGLGKLCHYVDEQQLIALCQLITKKFESSILNYKDKDDEFFQLYSLRLSIFTTIMKSTPTSTAAIPVASPVLHNILKTVFNNLTLPQTVTDFDDDFDKRFKVDQVRDDALICLQAITTNVPFEVLMPQTNQILSVVTSLLNYDPFHDNIDDTNINDNASDSEEVDGEDEDQFEMSDDEGFEYEPEEEENNDYDLSWSIRKNCAKLIANLIETTTVPIVLKKIYSMGIFTKLISKMDDHSSIVSNEVIITLTKIIAATSQNGDYYAMTIMNGFNTKTDTNETNDNDNARKRRSQDDFDIDVEMINAGTQQEDPVTVQKVDPFDSLMDNSDAICEKLNKKLSNDNKTKNMNNSNNSNNSNITAFQFSLIFALVTQLTEVLNGYPPAHLHSLLKTLDSAMYMNKESMESFRLYSQLLKYNDLRDFGDHVKEILDQLIHATSDNSNYELISEGLTTSNDFFQAVALGCSSVVEYHHQTVTLTKNIASKIESRNYSNEVKKKCLHSLSVAVKNYHHSFSPLELKAFLHVYEQTIMYESLIEPTISELTDILNVTCSKIAQEDLERILARLITLLDSRSSSDLKNSILDCLAVVSATSVQLPLIVRKTIIDHLIAVILKEQQQSSILGGKQVSESLLIIANFITTLDPPFHDGSLSEDSFLKIIDTIIPIIESIERDHLFMFSSKIAANIAGGGSSTDLFSQCKDKYVVNAKKANNTNNLPKDFQNVIPGILASIAVATDLESEISNAEEYIVSLAAQLNDGLVLQEQQETEQVEYNILFMGYVGKYRAISCGLDPFLKINNSLCSADNGGSGTTSGALKIAVLDAIGNIASSDVKRYLPQILEHMVEDDSLVIPLRNLLEVKIINGKDVVPVVQGISEQDYNSIWDLLLTIPPKKQKQDYKNSLSELNLCAECLTLISLLDSTKIDQWIGIIDSTESITSKYTIVSTIKYFLNFSSVIIFSNKKSTTSFDKILVKLLEKASLLVFNDDLNLKQTSIQALTNALHSKPSLALPILSQLIPTIMEKELLVKKEYIDAIQIGPFKHKIDNALDYRKNIYEMIYTVLTIIENMTATKTVQLQQSLNYPIMLKICIEKGLKDDNDVIQLSSIIIAKVCNLCPNMILFQDETLLTAFKERCTKIINKKSKESDTKQVLEKQKESIKCIKSLITNIDKVFRQESSSSQSSSSSSHSLSSDVVEDWRKFVFLNGNN